MLNSTRILILLFIPITAWLTGFFNHKGREIVLPRYIKFLYGKPNAPLYMGGFLSQSVGLIFVFSYILAFLHQLITAYIFFTASGIILFMAVLFDGLYLRSKHSKLDDDH